MKIATVDGVDVTLTVGLPATSFVTDNLPATLAKGTGSVTANTIPVWNAAANGSGYTLKGSTVTLGITSGTINNAATKTVVTDLTNNPTSTNLPTGSAVTAYVDDAVDGVKGYVDGLITPHNLDYKLVAGDLSVDNLPAMTNHS